jgi:hypothetical protein
MRAGLALWQSGLGSCGRASGPAGGPARTPARDCPVAATDLGRPARHGLRSQPMFRAPARGRRKMQVVQDALTRTLDVPRRDIRRSRAALFTSIVLPHLRLAHRAA